MAEPTRTADADAGGVVIVGAGPVGLLLAAELRLGGAEVVVLEQRGTPTTESRASTLHARTMEILDSRGLLDRFGAPPNEPRGHFGGIPLDLTLPSRYPGQWKVPQDHTEAVLQEWAGSLGADIRRGHTVLAVESGADQVEVTAGTDRAEVRLRARYLVACDGEQSTVRDLLGADFPGEDAGRELLRADVAGISIPNRRFERLERGLAIAARRGDGVTRVMVHEFDSPPPVPGQEPEFGAVVDAWKRVTGEDLSGGTPLWANSFGDANRQLSSYRHGRVLFAGDAAHRQLPVGGQALNLGLQDAFNLGWKLALHLRAQTAATDALLDSYHTERHAVGSRVLSNIKAQALLLLGGQDVEAVRTVFGELIGLEDARRHLAGMISGLDIRYDLGAEAHPLLGRRLPHLALAVGEPATATSSTELLRTGRGVLVELTGDPDRQARLREAADAWTGRVDLVTATPVAEPGPEGPTLDELSDVGALLVRPDGHVAWVGSAAGSAQPQAALRRCFGEPAVR